MAIDFNEVFRAIDALPEQVKELCQRAAEMIECPIHHTHATVVEYPDSSSGFAFDNVCCDAYLEMLYNEVNIAL